MTDRGGCRVLVVDDDPDTVEVLSVMVEFLEHATRGATSGAEATAVAREYKPDVVVLDLDLPDMHGREVARRIRSSSARPPWIIVITGWVLDASTRHELGAEVDEVVTKPIGLDTMRSLFRHSPARHRYRPSGSRARGGDA